MKDKKAVLSKRKRRAISNLVLPVVVISFFLVIILIFYRMLYKENVNNIIMDGEITARKTADQVDKYIQSNMDYVSLAAYALDEMIIKKRSEADIQDFLVRQTDAIRIAVDKDTTGIYAYIGDRFYSGNNWIAPDDYDATLRPWYIRPMEEPGKMTLLDAYLDMETGRHMMAIGRTLVDGTSVVSMDMSIAGIQKIVDQAVSSGAADMGMVISPNNLVIAHSDRSEVGRDYDVQSGTLGEMIVRNLEDKEDYYFEFRYEDSDYMVYVATIQCGLHCISVKNVSKAFMFLKHLLWGMIIVVILFILVANIVMSRINLNDDTGDEMPDEGESGCDEAPPAIASQAEKKKQGARPLKYDPNEHAPSFIGMFVNHPNANLGTKVLRLVLIVLLISETLIGVASILQSRSAIRASVCQRMIDIANCAAGAVNGDVHERLTPEDVGSDDYYQVFDALVIFRDNAELEYVYAVKKEDDGRFTLTVDPSFDDPAQFGAEIDVTEGLINASMGIPSVDDWQHTDEWGTFYSAYSPIFDSAGVIAGIVGVDFSVDWFEGQIDRQTRTTFFIYIVIMLVTMSLTWLVCYIWLRSITEPLGYMTEIAKRYGKGDFEEKIETGTGDEIGILSHTLQVMAGSLQEQIVRAETANEAKSNFLANMSHEIRTPINTVLGMNEMILRESEDNTILYYAKNIKSAGKSLLNLINDILDFSKIEAGKTEITPVEYNLADLLGDVLVLMQSRAYDKGLSFNIDFNPEIPEKLYGDEGRIRQVITNLLSNAIKYTKEGGVVFCVGYKKDPDNDQNVCLEVSVSDTGSGIKKEDMHRLFTKFERIDEKSNRNIEGTGLGLSITQSLLELMGSSLKVESEYGKGSVFSFELRQRVVSWNPMGDYRKFSSEFESGLEEDQQNFSAASARILAVDDNPMNLVVFTNLIKHTRAQVDTAGSGDEGLKKLSERKYDLIFLDHMMPDKDGIETLRELKEQKDNPNVDTPAICLTANAISGAKEQYISAGFDDYLSKPIDPILLDKCLLGHLPENKIEMEENAGNRDDDEMESAEIGILLNLRKKQILDVDTGLKNNGTARAYLSILLMYYRSIESRAEEIEQLYRSNDLKNYTIQVHALKSSSRIVGLMELGEKAQKLESAAKSADVTYVQMHHEEFMNMLLGVKKALSDELEGVEPESAGEKETIMADAQILDRVYNDIRQAAESMDIDGLERILAETDKYMFNERDKARLLKIREAIDNFDYSSVVEILGE